jgi:hypothetical protein
MDNLSNNIIGALTNALNTIRFPNKNLNQGKGILSGNEDSPMLSLILSSVKDKYLGSIGLAKINSPIEPSAVDEKVNVYDLLGTEAQLHLKAPCSLRDNLPKINEILNRALNLGLVTDEQLERYKEDIRQIKNSFDGLAFLGKLRVETGLGVEEFQRQIPEIDENRQRVSLPSLRTSKQVELDLKECLREVFGRGAGLFNPESPIKLLAIQPNGYQSAKLLLNFEAESGQTLKIELMPSQINPELKITGRLGFDIPKTPAGQEFLRALSKHGINPSQIVAEGSLYESVAAMNLADIINAFVDEQHAQLSASKDSPTATLPAKSDENHGEESFHLVLAKPENTGGLRERMIGTKVKLRMYDVPRNSATIKEYKREDEMLWQHHERVSALEKGRKTQKNHNQVEIVFNPTAFFSMQQISQVKEKVSEKKGQISHLEPSEILKLTEINGVPVQDLELDMRPSFKGFQIQEIVEKHGIDVASQFKMYDGGGTASNGFIGLTDRLLPVIAAQKHLLHQLGISVQNYARKIEEAFDAPLGARIGEFSNECMIDGKLFECNSMSFASAVSSPFEDRSSSNTTKTLIPIGNKGETLVLSELHEPMIEKYCFSESTDGITGNGYAIFPQCLNVLGLTDTPTDQLKTRYETLKDKYTQEYQTTKVAQIQALESLQIFSTDTFASYFLVNLDKTKSREEFAQILEKQSKQDPDLLKAKQELDELTDLGKDWFSVCLDYGRDLNHKILQASRKDFVSSRIQIKNSIYQ